MGKLEYLDALQRAMAGLPPGVRAKTLAYYEQRFVDAAAAGQDEAELAQELGDPKKIAMTLRANAHMNAFERTRNPVQLLRVAVSVLGLAIFNLFMVVPAMVYGAMLAALYAAAMGCYVAGIAITASGLAGANELVLDGPFRHIIVNDDPKSMAETQTRIDIGETGVQIYQEKVPGKAGQAPDAGNGIRVETAMQAGSRTTQTLFGLAIVLGGIVLFLLSLVVSKYTLVGIKRYVQMNASLLKGS